MSVKGIYEIGENRRIASGIYLMKLLGDNSAITKPGQFVNIALDGFYLRRPISIFDVSEDGFSIIYKVVGEGTQAMSEYPVGTKLDILMGLGNGFDISKAGEMPLLIGGGCGCPPMYYLAKKLIEAGKTPVAILGFNSAEDVICADELRALGVEVTVTTVDGSVGTKGFVTNAFDGADFDYFFACGPEPMLKAIAFATEMDGQLSFEARMACGFGGCMGCTCRTKYGNKRICVDGPVLLKEEVIW